MARRDEAAARGEGAPWRQLPLEFAAKPNFAAEDFFVSDSNENAYAMVELWPNWPHEALFILGPQGAGKSHLGAIWAQKAEAEVLAATQLKTADVANLAVAPLLLEDAEGAVDAEAQLFHLFNLMRERGTALVLTARTPPDAWGLQTADLLSRLRLVPCVAIQRPDDALIRAALIKLLIDRQLVVDARVVDYAALRLERSLEAARAFVETLDREALARKARITRAMAAEVLRGMSAGEEEGPKTTAKLESKAK